MRENPSKSFGEGQVGADFGHGFFVDTRHIHGVYDRSIHQAVADLLGDFDPDVFLSFLGYARPR